ncbi:hypothetical protein BD560DRAFT_339320 [Blakeslea trispora]|nr:hypothetical protein BD560DRAFT_339320 [Blakeslea trispora]
MDPTVNYARVMRIRPEEEEDDWEAVPYEEGWSQVKGKQLLFALIGSRRLILLIRFIVKVVDRTTVVALNLHHTITSITMLKQ